MLYLTANKLARYSETVDLLYNNMFDFDSLDTVISLSKTVLKPRLDHIRIVRLQFEFPHYFYNTITLQNGELELGHNSEHVPPYDVETWEQTCRVLASIRGLEELYMQLGGFLLDELVAKRSDCHIYMLRPLLQIQQARIFELTVPWGPDPATIYCVPGAPFRIIPMPVQKTWDC